MASGADDKRCTQLQYRSVHTDAGVILGFADPDRPELFLLGTALTACAQTSDTFLAQMCTAVLRAQVNTERFRTSLQTSVIVRQPHNS